MLNRNVLITGGSGFIGRNLFEFLGNKYRVFIPTHRELDLLDAINVRKYVQKNKIKVIIHGANVGGARDTVGLKSVVEINLRMFFNIARCADLVDKIISFGSGAEYNKNRDLKKVEEADFDEMVPEGDYGFYKYIASKYILSSEKIVCLRLFGVYGKYEDYLFKFISNAIVKNLLKMPIVIGQNVVFDYLFIDDLVKIIDFLFNKKAKYKDYNIASGESVDLIRICKIINEISYFKSEVFIKNKGLNFEYTANNNRLKKELGKFRFTTIEEGIRKLYFWYRVNLNKIDKAKVMEDPYLDLIKIRN